MPNHPGPPSAFPLDKLAHFLLFAGFGALWLRSYPGRLTALALPPQLAIGMTGTLLGLAIEIAQSRLGWGRMGEGADLLANCAGLFFALGAETRLRRLHDKKVKQN